MKIKKVFLIEIEFLGPLNEWFDKKTGKCRYIKGERIVVPVVSSTAYHAETKFQNRCWGSEYPAYKIVNISATDNFIFRPILE